MIEMHVNSSYTLYNAESRSRWFWYPSTNYPTYYYGWVIPDGNIHGTTTFSVYQAMILNRMNVASSIDIRMWGDYNPSTLTGNIYARYYNETAYPLSGNVLFVITEDSLYVSAPNGDGLHNFVARDYIPSYTGVEISVPGNDSVVYSQPFTIASNWTPSRCEIVTFFQSTRLSPDSTKEMYQGGKIKVRNLPTGIEENSKFEIRNSKFMLEVSPNPCVNYVDFSFSLPKGSDYTINIYNASGQEVKRASGFASGNKNLVRCDMRDVNGGVYFYRLVSDKNISTGKIIVSTH